ncbi:MAG: DUF3575 domain-containing protein [Bacteroidales bacterium]|nr:DUF3575 domain-containing protein [Bacteroidales bacterium]
MNLSLQRYYFSTTVKFRTFSVQSLFRYWVFEKNDGFFTGAHFGYSYYNPKGAFFYLLKDYQVIFLRLLN